MNRRSGASDELNYKYYAENNDISFSQFGKDYHFTDAEGRQYIIGTENERPFANARFGTDRPGSLKCYINEWDYARLYVKLPKKTVPWFSSDDVDRPLRLSLHGGDEREVTVIVRQLEKTSVKRRTGVIYVSGLTRSFCNAVLNK